MNARIIIAVFCLITGLSRATETLPPGRWELSSDGEIYSLNANQADVRAILDAIREISPADFQIRTLTKKEITLQRYNVPLDKLLDGLELSFVLQYERAENEKEYQVSKGWISFSEPASSTATRSPFADSSSSSGSAAKTGQTIPEEIRHQLAAAKPNQEYRAPSPVTVKVDGNPGDWPAGIPRQQVTHKQIIAGQAPTNDADASFGLAGAADDEYLYLAIDITDDLLATNRASSLPLARDDNLEIIISAGGTPVSAVINRHHVLTGRDDGDDTLHTTARQLVSFNNGTKAAILNSADGWKLEVAVPLDSLADNAGKVNTLGFNVLLQDADQGEGDPSVLSWSSGGTLTTDGGVLRILKMP